MSDPLRTDSTLAIVIRCAVLVVLLAGLYRTVALSWADVSYRSATREGLHRAASLVPSDPLYHYANALLLQQRDPVSPEIEKEFAAAVQASPRYSDALLGWSVAKEMRGDRDGAEQLLLRAASTDHLLRPAWALTNYYFRQGMIPQFLAEAKRSLHIIGITGISEDRFNPYPIFKLLTDSGASRNDILAKGLPEDRAILDFYLGYATSRGDMASARDVADKILPGARLGTGDPLFLFPYVNTLIDHNDLVQAAEVWAKLYDRKMVPYPGPNPANGIFLTNGTFSGRPLNFGFDWRPLFKDPVRFLFSPPERGYTFTFDGNEAEDLQLLVQVLPLNGNTRYRFAVQYKSDFDPDRSGLRWSLTDHRTGKLISADLQPSIDGANPATTRVSTVIFKVPAETTSGDLHLNYVRQPATVRIQGLYKLLSAELKTVQLTGK